MAPVTLNNNVNKLTWNVPIVNSDGSPTNEFMRKWAQQGQANASVPDLTTAKAVSAIIDLISSTVGALLVRGATQWTGLVPVADGRVLRDKGVGATPIWDTITDILDTMGSTRGNVLSRGATQWSTLAIGGANTILKSTGTDPAWSSLTSLLDTVGAAQGDVLYRDAGVWQALAPGTAGQVLTTGGAAANPAWATPAGGSGGGAASIQDDGTNLYVALSDTDGQLVLDGSGDPIFSKEVLPPNSLPIASSSAFGAVKADGTSIAALAGVLSTGALCFQAKLTADQTLVGATQTLCKPDTFITNTLGVQYAVGTGKFTPTKAGKYAVFCTSQGKVTSPDTVTQATGSVWKNGGSGVGTQICVGQCGAAPAAPVFSFVSLAFGVADMNGTTDTLELSVRVDSSGASGPIVELGAGNVTFGAIYIGA